MSDEQVVKESDADGIDRGDKVEAERWTQPDGTSTADQLEAERYGQG
jgi:hypothetical protein